ncbi:Zn(II)2Cys6 transcription factor domain-containing protein ASCRUDRAFT_74731 [Ascoidea rubescens DSM 1968]|uniref:Zn(2)-C6 fungal-type domain-containing protein n=1 Tax=Ascoidea rubescens DSM 1968 TaxID=1344418 RepID=A0A1D2VL49_9ASCO|nr:hypothetical protein ASCRUDRAFT_74731 [Ascoidea rubescens DSM 1968]ODV62325.1 hypothetical protein ASCRUDRAFT_74731 [Ascoidea rubescens DSM 1968]
MSSNLDINPDNSPSIMVNSKENDTHQPQKPQTQTQIISSKDENNDNNNNSNNNSNNNNDPTKPATKQASLNTTDFANKWRQVRACARCHRLKMRCAYDDPSYTSCKRCFSAGVECSLYHDPTSKFKTTRPRKKQKTNLKSKKLSANSSNINPIMSIDDAIEQLFQSVDYLKKTTSSTNSSSSITNNDKTNNTNNNNDNNNTDTTNSINKDNRQSLNSIKNDIDKLYASQNQLLELQLTLSNIIEEKTALYNQKYSLSTSNPSNLNINPTQSISSQYLNRSSSYSSLKEGPVHIISKLPPIPYERNLLEELIRLKFLTYQTAISKFNFFKSNLLPYWPILKIPLHYSFDYMIKNKPLLLLACIIATCLNKNDVELHDKLSYYLEKNLSQRVCITGDILIDIISCYLILCIWNSPPKKWGSFKHQLDLLLGFSLSLVLDLKTKSGEFVNNSLSRNIPLSNDEKKLIRSFLATYCCGASLELALPKFKLVSWSIIHENCSLALISDLNNQNNDPKDTQRSDIYLSYLSRLLSIGQEMQLFFSNSYSLFFKNDSKDNKNIDQYYTTNNEPNNKKVNDKQIDEHFEKFSKSFNNKSDQITQTDLKIVVSGFENKLLRLMYDYRLTDNSSTAKESYLVGITYNYILMTMYDHIICKILTSTLFFNDNTDNDINDVGDSSRTNLESHEYLKIYDFYLLILKKLINSSKNLISLFLVTCQQTLHIPTFFNYRPMNAFICLLKAKVLIQLIIQHSHAHNNTDNIKQIKKIDFNLIETFNSFYYKYKQYSQTSIIFNKFFLILIKIKSWLKIISDNNFMSMCDYSSLNNFLDVNNQSDSITTTVTNNSLVILLKELGKEKAVESLKPNFVDIKNSNSKDNFSLTLSNTQKLVDPLNFISPVTTISLASSQNSLTIDNSPYSNPISGLKTIDSNNSKDFNSGNSLFASDFNEENNSIAKSNEMNPNPQLETPVVKSLFDKQHAKNPNQINGQRSFLNENISNNIRQTNQRVPIFEPAQHRNSIENFDNMLKDIFMENQMDDFFNVTLSNVDFDDKYFQQLMNDGNTGANNGGNNGEALSPSSISGLFQNSNDVNNPFGGQPIYKQVQSHWEEVFDFSPVPMKTNSSSGTPRNNDEQYSENFESTSDFRERDINSRRALSFNNSYANFTGLDDNNSNINDNNFNNTNSNLGYNISNNNGFQHVNQLSNAGGFDNTNLINNGSNMTNNFNRNMNNFNNNLNNNVENFNSGGASTNNMSFPNAINMTPLDLTPNGTPILSQPNIPPQNSFTPGENTRRFYNNMMNFPPKDNQFW